MKQKLLLTVMLLLTLVGSADAQSRTRKRAASRAAALLAQKSSAEGVPTTAAVPVSPAVQPSHSSVANGVIHVEWVEFVTPPTGGPVGDLYAVASGFARGSLEFCEIVALTGRLFPSDPQACINAAGVALLRGDAPTARRYLQQMLTDPRAYNNVGLLYLLEGNRDKAEVYLQLAVAAGTSLGAAALK